MARFFSRSGRSRRGRNSNSLYLAGAVIAFVVVVFLLFRGDSSAPQEAGAQEMPPDAAATEGTSEPAPTVAAEANPPSGSPEPRPQVSPERARLALPGGTVPATQAAQRTPAPVQRPPVTTRAAAGSTRDGQADAAVAEAMAMLKTHPRPIIAARDKLNATLSMSLTQAQEKAVKAEMAALSQEWLFGPAAYPGDTLCSTYTVKRGDLLQVIGRRHKVPFQILMKLNNIPRPQSLQAGKAIKVTNGPFHAKVSRTAFKLDLYLRDTYVRSFKVGLGRPGYETPTGRWRVQEGGKLERPTWTDPDTQRVYKATDPDYPLGSRWIALDGVSGAAKGRTGFAIHGTKDPEQIGAAGSRGCIRMYNGEAILVYNMLFPLYSTVEVFD